MSRTSSNMLSRLTFVAMLILVAVPAAVADPVFTIEPPSDTLTAFRLIVFGGGEIDDVRGAALVDVSNPGPVGQISLLDPSGGVPFPSFATLAFGNLTINGADSTFTQETQVVLDMASAIVTPTTLALFGVGTAVGPVTDAALAATLGRLEFDFKTYDITTDPNSGNVLATYQFVAMERVVPEPSYLVFLLLAFAGSTFATRRLRGTQN